MKILVMLVHAGEAVRQRYKDTLRDKVDGAITHFCLINSPHGAFSSAYAALANELSGKGSLLAQVARYGRAPLPLDKYDAIVLASFSAGYKLVERVLSDPLDAEICDGVVFLDSQHAALDSDGTASDFQLAPIVRHALRAKEGDRVCWLAHTDVQTYGYASTTQVAQEVKRLCGLPVSGGTDLLQVGPVAGHSIHRGGLRVMAVDAHKDAKAEHAAALTQWGDEWLAMAVNDLIDRIEEVDAMPRPILGTIPDISLGERALAVAFAETGMREWAGTQHNPRILEYLAGSMRGGVRIGSALRTDETPWCAAAASWCLEQALVDGEDRPHGYRCSVRELWSDAIAAGTSIGASKIRRGEYIPKPGDLAILTRGGPAVGEGAGAFSRTAGKGHVGRIIDWAPTGAYHSFDGNVRDTWTKVARHMADSTLVGVIAYPLPAEVEPAGVATEDELDGLRALDMEAVEAASRKFGKAASDFVTEMYAAAGG